MKNLMLIVGTLIVLAHVAVPLLKSWELPTGNVASAHAAAALEVE